MGVSQAPYEESRRKRLEENKKRMEELNLHKLSESLRTPTSPKSSAVSSASRFPSLRNLSPSKSSSFHRFGFVDKEGQAAHNSVAGGLDYSEKVESVCG